MTFGYAVRQFSLSMLAVLLMALFSPCSASKTQTPASTALPAPDLSGKMDVPVFQGKTAEQWADVLLDTDATVRRQAFDSLAKSDTSSGPVLTQLLGHWHLLPRTVAALGLFNIAPAYPASITGLIRAAGDVNLNVRYWAISALARYGSAARAAVPALIKALETHEGQGERLEGPSRYYTDARGVAAEALGKIGPEARAALPHLEKALHDPSSMVRDAAAAARTNIMTLNR